MELRLLKKKDLSQFKLIHNGCFRFRQEKNVISGVILRSPERIAGALRKGVVVCNFPRIVTDRIPDLKELYWIVQRTGWKGFTVASAADIQLVDDFRAQQRWNRLAGLLPAPMHWNPGPDKTHLPVPLPFGNADFVDTEVFAPDGRPKTYDAIMIARWDRFKHHQLLVDAFRILKREGAAVRGLMFGHFANTDDRAAIDYKKRIVETVRAEGLPIDLPAADAETNQTLDQNKNSIAALINASRVGLLLSRSEAINRFKMECLSCDIPMIICDDACWCVKKHIGSQTGIVVARRADAVAKAIMAVKGGMKFSPRDYIMANTGIDRAMAALQNAVDALDLKMGLEPAPIARYDGRNNSLQWHNFIDHLRAEIAKTRDSMRKTATTESERRKNRF